MTQEEIKTINLNDFLDNISENLHDFAKELIADGFTLYTTIWNNKRKHYNAYFSFSKGGKFGSVQNGYDTSFGSEYIGGRENGSGCRYTDGFAELTLENANGCLNFTAHWQQNRDSIKFHTEKTFLGGIYSNRYKLVIED